MIRSMTGFGQSRHIDKDVEILVELKSVNHRFLEVNLKSPEIKSEDEEYFKKTISKKLKRGKVDIYIKVNASSNGSFQIDRKLLTELKKIIKNESLLSNELRLRDIKDIPGILKITKSSNVKLQTLKKVFNKALADFLKSRIEEGTKIHKILINKINKIQSKQIKVSKLCKRDLSKKIEIYKKRVKDILEKYDANSLDQEITHLAMKADVSEELERIDFHLLSIRKELNNKNSSGKKIDFILQELFRESNTLSVKLDEPKTKNIALEVKVLVEEMREQIQNIE
ncbi:MAG: YicC/YloC family endoribonuclease [Gammaproteobacteria bacterium]